MKKLPILFTILIITFFACSPLFVGKSTSDIDVKNATKMIRKNADNTAFIILDVRTDGEYANGHLENAHHINYFSKGFSEEITKMDKSVTYLVYCKTGGRSASAVTKMTKAGFTDVYNLLGGIDAWEKAGQPVLK